MKDEERLEYMIWRSDRDVVRTGKEKPAEKPPEKATEKDKEPKKPFVDRVLQKALEHLKSQLPPG
jgi:hypothetical protein